MTTLSATEAAHVAGVSAMTISNWIRSGRLPAERQPGARGRRWVIKSEDLRAAINDPFKKLRALALETGLDPSELTAALQATGWPR